jgi:catechol 2,3-dioxygenase-like lactoylglutathione lyase family enzyme
MNEKGTFFHIGILVEDLDVAISSYTKAFGVRFRDPVDMPMPGLEEYPPLPNQTTSMKVAFSIDGPPYFELIKNDHLGLFGQDHEGIHHIGAWDSENVEQELQEAEVGLEARNILPDGCVLTRFTRPDHLHGVRFELVDHRNAATIQHFLDTGQFPE